MTKPLHLITSEQLICDLRKNRKRERGNPTSRRVFIINLMFYLVSFLHLGH